MKIKADPEDFLVEEITTIKPAKTGDHIYVLLEKRNWTTARALQAVARALRITKRRIGFAGNKDKLAITKQVLSIWKVDAEQVEAISIKDISLQVLGYGSEPVTLGDLKANKFIIRVKEVIPAEKKCFEQNFSQIKKTGFLNYFGAQRFGEGSTHLIGREIIRGDFEAAVKQMLTNHKSNKDAAKFANYAKKNWGKWAEIIKHAPAFLSLEKSVLNYLIKIPTDYAGALRKVAKPIRRLYVHSYQSWLFNEGLMALAQTSIVPKTLPIPGYETILGKDAFAKKVMSLLKKDALTLDDLRVKRMPEIASAGDERSTTIKPEQLSYKEEDEDSLVLSFDLPKGAYATVLIDQLFGKAQ